MASFSINQRLALRVDKLRRAELSLASRAPGSAKDVLDSVSSGGCRKTIAEHASAVSNRMSEQSGGAEMTKWPCLAVSVRNTWANPRCGAWFKGVTPQFMFVDGETPGASRRDHHFIGYGADGFSIMRGQSDSKSLARLDWAISGPPTLWDDESVWESLVVETADPAHLYRLPRGIHPAATTETIQRWTRLRKVFMETIESPSDEAFGRLTQAADGLERESSYFHNLLGVTETGEFIVLMKHGKLEDLGQEIQGLGAQRAIMVDNGGSCSVHYFREGLASAPTPLLAYPSHRPKGTAYLFLFLESSTFSTLA
ncbi:MAG: hypothetical protein ACI8UO_005171 [Verrucomicrobiales bacterium]|jgi:hypothetical protein